MEMSLNYAERLECESPLSLWCLHPTKAKEDFRTPNALRRLKFFSMVLPYFFLMFMSAPLFSSFESTKNLPVACNGRFCSLESASRLWLYDFYHQQKLKKTDLDAFHVDDRSALNLLWLIHFRGHKEWDHSPFFWIHYAQVKSFLKLDPTQDRFSFDAIHLNGIDQSDKSIADQLQELSHEIRLYESYNGSETSQNEEYEALLQQLEQKGISPKEISQTLEMRFPLSTRLKNAGTTLKMLPLRTFPGEWVSLNSFRINIYNPELGHLVPVGNFTSFKVSDFEKIRKAYFALELSLENNTSEAAHVFYEAYSTAYNSIAGRPYKQSSGKALDYPSVWRLQAETMYYQIPLIEMTIAAYALALFLMAIGAFKPSFRRLTYAGIVVLLIGLLLHTLVLVMRCYILQRPPVSNMFETVVYVPWVALVIGWIFYLFTNNRVVLAAATFASLALLVLLKLTQVDARMENVQAVLDSQYWLIIHVLMVVGSYGAFIVCGILGHFYLIKVWISQENTPETLQISKGILHTMYLGVALLIPGTILGGVWAAESWGRFWDWDPKESWAFITACVYLLIIHAYTFKRIRNFGLAVGAVAGLMAVSFTWYGVNYILGTGLHSYGFGSGGELYYYSYLTAECLFLLSIKLKISFYPKIAK